MSTLRVATYNIHKGVLRDFFGLRRVARIHDLRARLHELDSDLIFLQEVQGENVRHQRQFEHWPSEPQDVFLAKAPSLKHTFETAYGRNASYLHGHHGCRATRSWGRRIATSPTTRSRSAASCTAG